MTTSRVEPGFDQDRDFKFRDPSLGLGPDYSKVLVVGNSQINRIVVAKIVERSGLRPVTESPVTAIRILPLMFPALLILDGGADNNDCDGLMAGVGALRRVSTRGVPAVILLSNRNGSPENLSSVIRIDAIVAKPFTAEQLQPAIERVIARIRG